MTDYRALCAELVDALAEWRLGGGPPEDTADADLIDRARALLAEPEPGEVPRIGHILRLAEIIREVDGRHDKGAAALAEAILSHPGICSAGLAALDEADGPAVPDGREPASVALQPSDVEVEKPAAWMCPAEPYWDGKEWRPRWQMTRNQELAEWWARPDKPTPLFTHALPTPEATND